MYQVLQSILFPGVKTVAAEALYVRLNGAIMPDSGSMLSFQPGAGARFDTFFGCFNVSLWRHEFRVEHLALMLRGRGAFRVRFGLHRMGCATQWLLECQIDLDEIAILELPFWSGMEQGLLFVELTAQTDGEIRGGEFVTRDRPRRPVKLGVVITHFRRKSAVLPAIARIRSGLLEDVRYREAISLIVVDNSRDIESVEALGAVLISNRNFGGSGGFSRGLLHLVDDGSYSHCLFMDDDASCEIESIRRTYALLSYASHEKLAVAGSLLREMQPHELFEKGALFDGLCRPLKSGLDMRQVSDLLIAEQVDCCPDYGGWWFFAFALADVQHFPFPFFVRGDDIMFGLMHKFTIVTSNGIGCWGDDFGLKSGPLPIYLDVRNHLVQGLTVLNFGTLSAARLAARFFLQAVLSYNYATARAVTLAVRHVTQGPGFWLQNLDTTSIRDEIGRFSADERMRPVKRADFDLRVSNGDEGAWRHLIRLLTLNGGFLPGFLMREGVCLQPKDFSGNLRAIFRFREVLYEYEPLGLGYVARLDRWRLLMELLRFGLTVLRMMTRYTVLRRNYHKAWPAMTSLLFWRQVYGQE